MILLLMVFIIINTKGNHLSKLHGYEEMTSSKTSISFVLQAYVWGMISYGHGFLIHFLQKRVQDVPPQALSKSAFTDCFS